MPAKFSAGSFDVRIAARVRHGLNAAEVKRKTARMLWLLGWDKAALSLALVGDPEIKALHRDYCGDDTPTDVITFGQEGAPGPQAFWDDKPFLGDIAVSVDTARRQARAFGHSTKYEIYFYICHGILHLIGFDDATPKQRGRMHRIQASILKQIGLS
ncbi:MAG TPA: rRNA maturation RNase YbeY [Verrucomicrobiae bacterium]|jgi:probable rRNA maturation factor|nr:rRNA maturation RNase YbeY [Verrucomicrobiae bacterium]